MSDTGASIPAGWYPDPSGARQWRVWNGAAWSDVTRSYGPVVPRATPTTLGVVELETLATLRRLTHFGVVSFYAGLALVVSVADRWPGHVSSISPRFASALLGVAIGLAVIGTISFAASVRALRGRWTLDAVIPVVNAAAASYLMSRRLGITNASFRTGLDAVITLGYVVFAATNPWFGLLLGSVAASQLMRTGLLIDTMSATPVARPVAS